MSEVAQTLGQRLKAERERRGVSKQKAADEMHIDSWVIDALEAGDYQRIGPSVYAKGHLKRYATILGLPAAEVVSGYDTKPASPAAAALQPSGVRMRFTAQDSAGRPWAKITAFAAIAVAVGGIVWWRPWHQRSAVRAPAPAGLPASASTPSAASSGAQDGVEPAPAAAVAAAPDAEALPPPAAPAADAAGPAAREVDATPGAGPARLRLSFSADSWVEVHDATGRRVFAGNGRANSVKVIAGAAPLKVYLGYASGVQLEINDRAVAIGPQYVTGDVARFEAGADAVLRRESRTNAADGAQPRAGDAPHD
ncbi:MAG: helix-turn-helix domain-containing protein [Steroidobacteraceae bacterium]